MTERPAARVRAVRRAWRERTATRGPAELAYAVYLVVVLATMVGVPALGAAARALSTPAALGSLTSPGSPARVVLGAGLVLAGALWGGALYGPVTTHPTLVTLLASTDVPRRVGLRRTFGGRATALGLAAAGMAGFFGTVLVLAGAATAGDVSLLALGGAALGVVTAVAWLAGQAFARHAWWLAAVAAALATLAATWRPAGGVHPAGVLGVLAVVVVLALLVTPRLLDALRGPDLLASAVRWEGASTTARYGDVQGALAALRALPRLGRRWRAVGPGHPVVRFAVADLVGAWRTPGRCTVGVLAVVAGAIALATAHGPAAPLLAGAGSLVVFCGLGTLCDGVRHAVVLAVGPTYLGLGRWRTLALHSVAPALVLAGGGLAGVAGAHAIGGQAHVAVPALALPLVLAVRVWSSAKGPLPAALLTPVPTPVGDVSGVNVALWLADAPVLATLAGAGAAWLVTAGSGGPAALVAVVGVALVLAGVRSRVDRL